MDLSEINDLPIEDVVGKYVQLKRKGANLQACCPFHTEKTPSFVVSPSKNIFKCFGCGKAGTGITFVMEHDGLKYFDAIKKLAHDHNIKLDLTPPTKEEQQLQDKRESIYQALHAAELYFADNLFKPENAVALEYALSRWSKKVIEENKIGFASDDFQALHKAFKEGGFKDDVLIAAGLIAKSTKESGKLYDFYRNRIMFPIHNSFGRVISFSGRILPGADKDQAKYMNGPETIVYKKENTLFGLHTAQRRIREKNFVYLVEGNPDVIRLQSIDKLNTVAPCGTSLTHDQIEIIKRYAKSVTIIGDSDNAGKKAMRKNAEKIIKQGIFCNVVELEDEVNPSEKFDPDNFFSDEPFFNEYTKNHLQDYFVWIAKEEADKCKTPDYKYRFIKDIVPVISKLPEDSHDLIIDQISQYIKPKKAFQDEIKLLKKETVQEKKEAKLPKSIDLHEYDEFGFYAEDHQYFFKCPNSDAVAKSNFTMIPKFHISSVMAAKRTFILTNKYGCSQTVEFAQKDLINLSGFKLRVESIGNFIWEGSDAEFSRLKRYLYIKTLTAYEITQLGWQKDDKCWAWSNGIFDYKNKQFLPIDENGIVSLNGKNFYLPAFSKMYLSEKSLYVAERMFVHTPGQITLHNIFDKFYSVFGNKAMTGIAFYMATLYRDIIFNVLKFFPILNLFGPKGSGKSEMALFLLKFFGNQTYGPNILNTSRPAMANHISLTSNALCQLEEYKNSIEVEKVEMIKGFFGGTGRSVMNQEKDKKKETSSVDVGVVICGQEMATADIAAFSRFIFETFNKTEFTENEKMQFRDLENIVKNGLTHITHEILSYRDFFIERFYETFTQVQKEVVGKITQTKIEDRILNNWTVVLSAVKILRDKIDIPFTYESFLNYTIDKIMAQNSECGRGNEMGIFWRIFEFLVHNNNNNMKIFEGEDYHLKYMTDIKTDKIKDTSNWKIPKRVLIMRHTRIFELYRKHGLETRENILPTKTLEYYVCNEKSYLGRMSAVSFKTSGCETRKITTALCFDYDMLHSSTGISIEEIKTNVAETLHGEMNEHEIKVFNDNTDDVIKLNGEKIIITDDLPC
jgi:DNA primase